MKLTSLNYKGKRLEFFGLYVPAVLNVFGLLLLINFFSWVLYQSTQEKKIAAALALCKKNLVRILYAYNYAIWGILSK